jgi:AraC-like DNA-binding protein
MNQSTNVDLFSVTDISSDDLAITLTSEQYQVLLFKGKGILTVDFVDYEFDGKIAFFTSPFQHFSIKSDKEFKIKKIEFHGDFYCIEYHKKEVACNGLLFNNIYSHPFISINQKYFDELNELINKLKNEISNHSPYSDPILKAYLQLILAIGSKIKRQELDSPKTLQQPSPSIEKFKILLEESFIQERSTLFYANELALSPSVFTKRCKLYYGKTPSQLIQERVILEAKKLIHLTHKSFKEISSLLDFKDEHYFSRYFKKNTGITPTLFREKVGISIVADLSKD